MEIKALTEQEIEQLMLFLKALADKTRLHIISLVTDQERSVEEIAALLDLKPPSVSHHLNKLKECGLVSMRPDGTVHFYRLNEDRLSTFLRDLSPNVLREVSEDLDTTGFDRKVLQTFLVNGKLIEIPAQRKKRDVILRRLVEEFSFDRQYTEKEINEVLKRFHEDASTLRREFIATKLMARENNIYWRLRGVSSESSGAADHRPLPEGGG